jgi:hypothetical protein
MLEIYHNFWTGENRENGEKILTLKNHGDKFFKAG